MADSATSQYSLQHWLTAFYQYLHSEKRYSPHTFYNYQRDLDHFSEYCQQHAIIQWSQVDTHLMRAYVATRHRLGLGGRSLQRELSAIRSFFNFLRREYQIKTNPVIGVSAPKSPRKLPTPLDADEMGQLLNINADKPVAIRDWAMMELMYSSGLRLAELVSLNIDSIDLADNSVPVTGKGAKTRIVPVGRFAKESLKQWLKERPTLAKPDEVALFVSQRGTRISPRSVQQRMKFWGIAQGVNTPVHPHRLRHSFASHLLESSGDLRAVQELLGHADISTTQIYTHIDFQHLAKVYDAAHPRARAAAKTKAKTLKNT